MNAQRDEYLRLVAGLLLVLTVILLVSSAVRFFEEQINDALNMLPATSPSEEFSNVIDMVVTFAAFGVILLTNLLWLPSFLVGGPWGVLALAGLCLLAAGYIRFRIRKRGRDTELRLHS